MSHWPFRPLACGFVVVSEIVLYAVSAGRDHAIPALWLTMIMLPYMPLVCLVAVLGAMLQAPGALSY